MQLKRKGLLQTELKGLEHIPGGPRLASLNESYHVEQ